jgi:raffinose/stachyose/melibiose transport system substrate-binding protein
MKKLFALLLAAAMCLAVFAGCAQAPAATSQPAAETPSAAPSPAASSAAPAASSAAASSAAAATEIYFLNFKPEIADIYKTIADAYQAETGVKVKVTTAAAGTYETTLRSEIAKADAPTIFQINGPVGYNNWKDYCLDLSKSKLYEMLTDKSLAVTSGQGVYGIPYVVEGYGIIYNDAIMQKYFALPGAKAVSMDKINNFATLKSVVEDMQSKKDQLGIQGVFASTSLLKGEAWRWQTHLANVPFFYEFKDNKSFDNTVLAGLAADSIEFKYAENYKNIFDLYLNNSVSKKGVLGNKTVNDSMAEFALGQCAMVQNGNWGASQISGVEGNTVADKDIKFLPIYTGVPGEETQGLCIGTENFLCINSKASPEKQQASIDFLVWLYSSDKGKAFVKDQLKFIAPFNTFTDAEKPTDPLAKDLLNWMAKPGLMNVQWTFAAFPSENFKNYFGDALLEYAQGTKKWEDVVKIVKDSWTSERAAAKAAAK